MVLFALLVFSMDLHGVIRPLGLSAATMDLQMVMVLFAILVLFDATMDLHGVIRPLGLVPEITALVDWA